MMNCPSLKTPLKVNFLKKMLSVTLTFERHANLVISNYNKFHKSTSMHSG